MFEQDNYKRKLKSRDELLVALGPRPRNKTIIMCHGTFDLVHPGHVRHLMYAKSQGDILIASLTSDEFISKADYRPFVPEQLRAMNLAALEVVDWVLIDYNPTPVENIKFLQPDFFAKGYEYFNNGVNAVTNQKTKEEVEALAEYGGEIVFTPGDVVFSSTNFIDNNPPNITNEKLLTLMESEGVTSHSLRSTLRGFGGLKVHVLGDTIVDSYVHCSLIGSGTAKSPTISVKHQNQVDYIGGAAIVAEHIRAAGAEVTFSTVLGDDSMKDFVVKEMAKRNIDLDISIDPTRVTTQKYVFIADDYKLLKVDKVDNQPITFRTIEQFQKSLTDSAADVFVFSDFRHGIFNRSTIPQLTSSLPEGKLRVADTQVASRWGNILEFQDFDLITPNEREARFALGDQDSVIRPLALELYKQTRCKTLILKLGDRGILTYREPSPANFRGFFVVDSLATNVVDPVGAGDALLAYATLSMVSTGSPVIASILGSMAAANACEQEGNIPVTPSDVLRKLDAVEQDLQFR